MKSPLYFFLFLSCFTIMFSSCNKEEIIEANISNSNQEISVRSSGLQTNQIITAFGNRIQHENDYSCEFSDESICGLLFDPAVVYGTEVFLGENEYITTISVQIEDTLVFEDWEFTATFDTEMDFPSSITIGENTHFPVQVCEYYGITGIPSIIPGVYEILPDDLGKPTLTFNMEPAYLAPPFPPLLTIDFPEQIYNNQTGEVVGSTICWRYTPFIIHQDGTSTLPWNTQFTITIKKLPYCNPGPWVGFSQKELKNFMNDENLPISDQVTQSFNYDENDKTWCYNYYFEDLPGDTGDCYVIRITFPDGSSTYALIKR